MDLIYLQRCVSVRDAGVQSPGEPFVPGLALHGATMLGSALAMSRARGQGEELGCGQSLAQEPTPQDMVNLTLGVFGGIRNHDKALQAVIDSQTAAGAAISMT
eukprot:1117907-Karenia_brevis.AAC.1